MPQLRCDFLDINNPNLVNELIRVVTEFVRNNEFLYQIHTHRERYFFISENDISTLPGWYIIIDNNHYPLYVGMADNFNKRLNTNYGTLDNFGNNSRKHDCIRNFIKKYYDANIFLDLSVIIIPEEILMHDLGITGLSKRDRRNIEKILNLFRNSLLGNL